MRARTLGTLALLTAALPFNLALTLVALARGRRWPRATAARPRTVLVSGGKMTKALTLARAFHRAGHRVVLVEQAKYRWTGHRFSRAVDAFHTVPKPDAPGYAQALLAIVLAEGVDVYVPVCSPLASLYDARAKGLLREHCDVLHMDPETVARLDDKQAFAELCASLELSVPEAHRIDAPEQVAAVAGDGGPYVLKSIAYDPVNRLDLTPLPRPTPAETHAFAASKPIAPENPWTLQALIEGREFCAHATARDGAVTVYCCCASSAFQVNYEHVDKPAIEAWVRRLVSELSVTGQVCFDFIEAADGVPYAIECNPRTHSAITVFGDAPALARAYLDDAAGELTPAPDDKPTYWLYHELWRILSRPGRAWERLRVLIRGRDAIFDWADPVPFLAVHHLLVPALLLSSLVRGRPWIRIDFNIGKLVEPAGD